jgi:hypothetical protein
MDELTTLAESLTTAILRQVPYVLVVDDKSEERQRMAAQVLDQGFSAIVAPTAQVAYEIAVIARPSGIVADQYLGVESNPQYGLKLVKSIKDHYGEKNGSMPAFVVSNNSFEGPSESDGPIIPKTLVPGELSRQLDAVRSHIVQMVETHLQPLLAELATYKDLVGELQDTREVKRLRGEVLETSIPELPEACKLRCDDDDEPFRFVPTSLLKGIDACFIGAQIDYTIYQLRAGVLSKATYVGPNRDAVFDEHLDSFSPEEEAQLAKTEWKD